jgi:SAM-dependent methyltransferase
MADSIALTALEDFTKRYPPRVGRTLVVGSKCYGTKPDRRLLYKDAIGLDLSRGEGVDVVHDMEEPLPKELGQFDHIDCVSVLEHVQRPWLMAKNIERALAPGGSLLICVPWSWRVHDYPGDFWRISAEALPILFPRIRWRVRKYLVEGRPRKMVPGKTDEDGTWIARSETAAMGFKCS